MPSYAENRALRMLWQTKGDMFQGSRYGTEEVNKVWQEPQAEVVKESCIFNFDTFVIVPQEQGLAGLPRTTSPLERRALRMLWKTTDTLKKEEQWENQENYDLAAYVIVIIPQDCTWDQIQKGEDSAKSELLANP
jgi:hypothetical protein